MTPPFSPCPDSTAAAVPARRRWWVETIQLVGIILAAELCLHVAVESMGGSLPPLARAAVDGLGIAIIIAPLFASMLYRQRVSAKFADSALPMSAGVSSRSPHRRIRWAVMVSLGLIATLVSGAVIGHSSTTASRVSEAEMMNLAGRQRMLSQRIARIAALAAVEPTRNDQLLWLTGDVTRLESEAAELAARVGPLTHQGLEGAAQVDSLLQGAAVDRLALARAARQFVQATGAPASGANWQDSVQRYADAYLAQSDHVVAQLQRFGKQRVSDSTVAARLLAGMVLLIIAFIAAFVLEPMIRLLQRQHSTMAARAEEFERLALVAQRTSNAVVITDAARRITWVNDGFTRITGYTLHEALGQSPGALLQGQRTAPETMLAMRTSLRAGTSFRGEILNVTRDGREYWLDLSIEPLLQEGRLTGYVAIESDITEQVHNRHALEEQGRRFDLIVQSANVGTWEWDLRTHAIVFNAPLVAMLGYSPSEIEPNVRYFGTLVHPDDVQLARARMVEHLEGHTAEYRCEHRLRRRDGSWCAVLSSGRVTERDVEGRALRVVGVHIDISSAEEAKEALVDARAKAEAALREITALRNALDEHSILSVADRSGRIVDINTGFCRISGYERDELLGNDHRILNSGVHPPEFWREVWRTISSGRAWRGEVCNRRKDGALYWVDSTIIPQLGSDGGVEKYVSIRFDITAQRQIGADLQQATSLLEDAQAVAHLGSWSIELDSGAIVWSRETLRLFGRTELDGPPDYAGMLSAYVPDDALLLATAAQRAASEGLPYSLVLRTQTGANGVRFVRGEGRARRDVDGRITGLFGTVMDVTAAVEREEALTLAQSRAEAASRSKSEFLANMSHEIRTPLTAILGYTDLLRDEAIATRVRIETVQQIDTIHRAGEHLLTLINDILDLSKIEAGRLEFEQIETELPRVLLDVDSLMHARAAEKGVALRLHLDSPIPDRILTDPTRLRQILMNLVGNAVKFTNAGRVDVRVRVTGTDAKGLHVTVEDTGPGLSAEQARMLFQPFTQADSSVTRRHGGTGLGLTISRRLAQLMGGDVALTRTAPGEGARFEVTIPFQAVEGATIVQDLAVCTDHAADKQSLTPATALRLSGRILLAEDGEDNQRLIAHHLRVAGAEVMIAENGRLALDAILAADSEGRPFDLLLTDMQMPEMDGYSLARHLRALQHRVPIVALTAHAMAEDRQRCLDAGCDDYATKPIDRHRLLATCAQWMVADDSTPLMADGSNDVIFPLCVPEHTVVAEHTAVVLRSDLADDADFAELIVGFLEGLALKLPLLVEYGQLRDRTALQRLVHQLKGAAGGYGFPTISDAARDVERFVAEGVDAKAVTPALAELLCRCEAALRSRSASTPVPHATLQETP